MGDCSERKPLTFDRGSQLQSTWQARHWEYQVRFCSFLFIYFPFFLNSPNLSNLLQMMTVLLCSATRVTVMLLKLGCDLLALGTEGGGVHFLELPTLTLLNKSLFQDEVMQRWELHFQYPNWPCHIIRSPKCYRFCAATPLWINFQSMRTLAAIDVKKLTPLLLFSSLCIHVLRKPPEHSCQQWTLKIRKISWNPSPK